MAASEGIEAHWHH